MNEARIREVLTDLRCLADEWYSTWENGLRKNADSSWGKHVAYSRAADMLADALKDS